MPYTYDYPRPAVTVDVAVFAKMDNETYILLINRKREPFSGYWALPGGFLNMNETLLQSARRELHEETGLQVESLQQFRTYDAVDRDPRHRTLTTVFVGFVENSLPKVAANDDAREAHWFNLKKLPPLAFDHDQIIEDICNYFNLQ